MALLNTAHHSKDGYLHNNKIWIVKIRLGMPYGGDDGVGAPLHSYITSA
jgi:hypothetical protein